MSSIILSALGWLTQTFFTGMIQKAGEIPIERLFNGEDRDGNRDGDGEALEKLKKSLLAIQPIIGKVESMWIEDENLKEEVNALLLQLKDAAYDADDLLDKIQYYAVRQQIEQQGDEARNLSSSSSCVPPIKEIKNSLLSSAAVWNIFSTGDSEDDDDVFKQMKETQERFSRIAVSVKEKIEWVEESGRGKELMLSTVSRQTSSLVKTQLFGRETELKELLSKLGDGSVNSGISVITIVGIGGVGKTTLVQEAYNNKISEKFECKFWVCVSENFSEERLTRELIESTTGEKCDLINFNTLQLDLMGKIASKRFLLVLDDVWHLDTQKWEGFCTPLRSGAPGSKILITTRFKNIADEVGSVSTISLNGLDEKSFWEYFEKCIFVSKTFGDYDPELKAIAEKNISKLKGLPLAARTLGRLLNQNLNKSYWEGVLENEIWKLPQKETDVLPVLQLSYQYLPTHLKRCFAFCSLFPKDYKFREKKIVNIWIAEGFIAPQGNLRMEDIGSIYFRELLNRSFFQQSQVEEKYVIHDLLHDLAELISEGECYRIEDTKPHVLRRMNIRHMSILNAKLPKFKSDNKLRTFMVKRMSDDETISFTITCRNLFERQKKIRVLVCKDCGLRKLPENIDNLIHLRYLDLSDNYDLKVLPESLCNLYRLQILILKNCSGELRLPRGMCKLINLRQLVAGDGAISTILEVGKLTSLQELRAFKVLEKHGHKIEELSHLTQLQGSLRIQNLENIVSAEEAKKGKLNNKTHLEELKLEWATPYDANNSGEQQSIVVDEILEALQPYKGLKLLTIEGYMGARSPSWLKALIDCRTLALLHCKKWMDLSYIAQLPHLKELHLEDASALEEIHNLGQLSCLDILHMKNLPALKQNPFSGVLEGKFFPVLKEIVLEGLLVLEEIHNLGQLSCLEILHMKNLPALKHNPFCGHLEGKFFPVLKKIVLEGLLALEEIHNLGRLSCLEILHMKNLPALKHNPFCGPLEGKFFPVLKEIVLERLLVLEGHGFFGTDKGKCFPCLKKLTLNDMPEWEEWSWPNGQSLFPCLNRFQMRGCPKLKRLPPLPYSLELLGLQNVGLTELPTLCREIESNCRDTMGACLSDLSIRGCQDLTSLEEGLFMDHLPNIISIEIRYCRELMRLPANTFKQLTSLKSLQIYGCPKLLIQDGKFDFFPPSLEGLTLYCCGDLNKFLPSYPCNLIASLTELSIGGYTHLVTFPRGFLDLKKLKTLSISNCDELKSIEEFGDLNSLQILTISGCPKLLPHGGNKNGESSSSLIDTYVEIDNTALLKLPSIRKKLSSILYLQILFSSEVSMFEGEDEELLQSLTDLQTLSFVWCENLQSLPTKLRILSRLCSLVICSCPQVKSLPETGLPASLMNLFVTECHPTLQTQSEEYMKMI